MKGDDMTEDKKYEEWLNEVRNRQPVLTNPEQLTADILKRASDISRSKTKNQIRLIGSWVTGIAATILLCLLITEITPITVSDNESPEYMWEAKTSRILPQNWHMMTLSEKGSYLSACQKEQERQKELIYEHLQKKFIK